MAQKFKFDFQKVVDQVKEEGTKKDYSDSRFWKVPKDEKNNGMAIIRFIPDMDGTPFVKYYSHNFNYMLNGVKKYYIKNCVSTFGFEMGCPICAKNTEYWNSPYESDKDLARQRKRKVNYVSNILVIKDTVKPENEGKVMLYAYGQKIYDKIKARMNPSETDLEDPDFVSFIPFDLYEGANFKIKVKDQGGYPNYDDSEFSPQSALEKGDDKAIEKIMKQTHKLSEFLGEDLFPKNEEVIKMVGSLLGMSTSKNDEDAPKEEKKSKPAKKEEPKADEEDDMNFSTDEPEEKTSSSDEDEEFFKNL